MHQLLHVLGFHDEQVRWDRDECRSMAGSDRYENSSVKNAKMVLETMNFRRFIRGKAARELY